MRNLAIIPARGGSKRIPGKNIKNFLGKPIIAYSIESALSSELFDLVMVSTDNNEIASISMKYGADIPFMRNNETASDYATLADVTKEVIDKFKEKELYFDNICLILPTVPFITIDLLLESYNKLVETDALYVHPIVKFSFPIQRAFKMSKEGKIEFINPEYRRTRSQDLDPMFHDAGMFYWIKPDTFFNTDKRYGVEVSEMHCHDIDNESDWKMAELKYRLFIK